MSLCNLSKNIEVHASIVGVLLTLACIGSLAISYYNKFGTKTDATFLVTLAWVILYWYGFLKRNRLCILIAMVCLAFAFIGTVCILYHSVRAVTDLGSLVFPWIVFALVSMLVEVYQSLVMAQLRESFLNDAMPNFGTEMKLPDKYKKQRFENHQQKRNVLCSEDSLDDVILVRRS